MRFLMSIAYDGANFNGFQRQIKLRTVQGEIEKVLTKINNNKKVELVAAGRTDALVHAIDQKAHFNLDIKITPYKLKYALNGHLPNDIYVNSVKEVSDDFHARYMVKEKIYEYIINMGEYNPLERNYVYQYNRLLNVRNIKKALQYLIGEHDFKAFASSEDKRDNCVRTIYHIKVQRKKQKLIITFCGNGFLKYMIRNIIGMVLLIGAGKKEKTDMLKVLEGKDRNRASITASPVGLYLKKVTYKEN
jgi:tRNA pseudouridine38-40 synthase